MDTATAASNAASPNAQSPGTPSLGTANPGTPILGTPSPGGPRKRPDPQWLEAAAAPDDAATWAIAGAMTSARAAGLPSALWLRGLDAEEFAALFAALFPGSRAPLWQPVPPNSANGPRTDDRHTGDEPALAEEFADLYALLEEAGTPANATTTRWLASAIASAALLDDHLWEDLRLPQRQALSALLQSRFPRLAARNTGNMRWKNFFYKQLCERAGMVCRAPSCGACDEYAECFGPE